MLVAVLIGLALAHFAAARGLLRSYPYSYSWSELLIDYQGGFAKRGLLGELAFQLRGWIPPREFVVAAVGGAYLLAVVGLVVRLRLPEAFAGLLFLFSPAGGLFPLLNPAAYGRKDAFVLLALVAGTALALRARHRAAALALPMAVFAMAGLFVEIAWFYYPLVFAATQARRRDEPLRWRLAASAAAAAFTLGCLGATLLLPPVNTGAIARSWNGVPYGTDDAGALCCINFGLDQAVAVARATVPNAGGYALALALGLLPLGLLLARRQPRRLDALARVAAFAGAVAAAGPVFVAADWGRYIALWLTATFLWGWVATRDGSARAPAGAPSREALLARGALLLLYAGTWQVAYYQLPDRSAFMPGLLFRLPGAAGR